MKTIFKRLIPIFLLTVACQKNAEKVTDQTKSFGHEQGNGTDNVPAGFGGAWVLGDNNEIKYCLEVGSAFGVDLNSIKHDLQRAFSIWKQYIISKRINENLEINFLDSLNYGGYPEGQAPAGLVEKSKLFRLTTTSTLMSSCDGSENIKFYFGIEDELVASLKKSYFNPTAFSFRSEYDSYSGKGKGLIWLAKKGSLGQNKGNYPDWSLPNRVLGVLLHELGHFYGVGHIEGTIMQENMFGLLLKPEWTSEEQEVIEYKMSHIDHELELFLPKLEENNSSYEGGMTFSTRVKPEIIQPEVDENFEFITGKRPVGTVVSKFLNQKIIISDAQSNYEFDITTDSHSNSAGKGIFSVERNWETDGTFSQVGAVFSLSHRSMITIGQIETRTGLKIPILIQQNVGITPFRISYIKDGTEKALMIMDYL